MVQFGNLLNEQENRRVREVIENGQESIFIYEPTLSDVDKIIDMQEEFVKSFDPDGDVSAQDFEISGATLVKKIFPLLTNIEGLEEMSDEEVDHIVQNPTLSLLQAQHVIEMIVTQVYKTVILSAKKEILDVDFQLGAETMIGDTVDKALVNAAESDPKIKKQMGKIDSLYDSIIEAEEDREKSEEAESIIENSSNDAVAVMEDYRKSFSDGE